MWLFDIWQEDVTLFHRSDGKSMTESFELHKLRRFDEACHIELTKRLKTVGDSAGVREGAGGAGAQREFKATGGKRWMASA